MDPISIKTPNPKCRLFLQREGGGRSVADPDPEPEGSETFGRIWIRFGTEINVSDPDLDPDSNPDPKLDPTKNM